MTQTHIHFPKFPQNPALQSPLRREESVKSVVVEVVLDDLFVGELPKKLRHPEVVGVLFSGAFIDEIAGVLEDELAVVAGDQAERHARVPIDVGVPPLVEVRLLERVVSPGAEDDLLVDADTGPVLVRAQVPAQAVLPLAGDVLLEEDLYGVGRIPVPVHQLQRARSFLTVHVC
ncbi:uncharacterized protein SCHCODRAFT_02600893 [Schizophyllum commune H4-8]|uniref:Uncharacterized protein n=1 Tax=Schizophyllum commune (strain H4-8 / FGSC 9210) TaxID=578458 RepID=D8Q9V4_SCHCM|nr:uncharacterized protein SCHCODRAFT_02600893 [Schizophyllum commune H4-8]KAI5890270.1 hypothetical protein SCHCODRAFT_02600893 [Schizophyllum commune H4-8]